MAEEIKEEVSKDLSQGEETASKESEEVSNDLSQSEETVSEESKANKKNEPFESRLRKFKRQSMGIVSEVRKRESYESTSVRRKKKSKEAEKRRHQRNGRFNSSKW